MFPRLPLILSSKLNNTFSKDLILTTNDLLTTEVSGEVCDIFKLLKEYFVLHTPPVIFKECLVRQGRGDTPYSVYIKTRHSVKQVGLREILLAISANNGSRTHHSRNVTFSSHSSSVVGDLKFYKRILL